MCEMNGFCHVSFRFDFINVIILHNGCDVKFLPYDSMTILNSENVLLYFVLLFHLMGLALPSAGERS